MIRSSHAELTMPRHRLLLPLSPGAAALLALPAAFLIASCDAPESATGPTEPGTLPTAIAQSISDGRSPGGTDHFYFLPPIQPTTDYEGTFDASLEPVVEICDWTVDGCGSKPFSFAIGEGLAVSASDGHYHANWSTRDDMVGGVYRIRVLLDGVELGHADAKIESNGARLKRLDTDAYVGLVENRTLPIKFRIEEGLTVVGSDGASVESPDGKVVLDLPPDALKEPVAVTVVEVSDPPPDPGLVPGSAYDFGPDGTEFATAVKMEVEYDPSLLPAGVSESRLRLHKRIGDMWREVPGSSVDPATRTVSGLVNSFSEYAVAASPAMFAGVEHTCSIDIGAVVRCWGRNLEGQLGTGTNVEFSVQPVEVASSVGQFATLTAGGYHTCGLTETGEAYCWGWNGVGQLGTGDHDSRNAPTPVATTERFKAITGGNRHTCALTFEDEVYCWGRNVAGQVGIGPAGVGTPDVLTPTATTAPSGVNFKSVSAGGFHTCALAQDASAYCWGENRNGQLGAGTGQPSRVGLPTPVLGGQQYLDISGATEHTCAVTLASEAYCWGRNIQGELGIGNWSAPVYEPAAVATSLTFLAVGGGERTSCGITGDGEAYCWGDNWYGTLGTGDWESYHSPAPVAGGHVFKSIREGRQHVCGITLTGEAYCWGHDGPGMLGNGTTSNVLTPSPVIGGWDWDVVVGGHHHTCGLLAETGGAYCWGRNLAGSLGNAAEDIATPTAVDGGVSFRTLDTHHNMHTCGIEETGTDNLVDPAYCWGSNLHGQLGTGDHGDRPQPTPVDTELRFAEIVTGGIQNQPQTAEQWWASTCALDESGAAWCWGLGFQGQLGHGSNASEVHPALVAGNHIFIDITIGADFACGLDPSGQAWCWGDDTSGELADGSPGTGSNVPVLAADGHTFQQISAGGHTVCALDMDGAAWCWGNGLSGQIGNGDFTTQANGPVAVAGGLRFEQISAGQYHVCALTADGQLYCWGENGRGQIGNGGLADVSVPTAVDTPLRFKSVDAVWIHTCAVTVDDEAYCWGHKGGGRLGNGQVAYHNAPQPVLGDATFLSPTMQAADQRSGASEARLSGHPLDDCAEAGSCAQGTYWRY